MKWGNKFIFSKSDANAPHQAVVIQEVRNIWEEGHLRFHGFREALHNGDYKIPKSAGCKRALETKYIIIVGYKVGVEAFSKDLRITIC